jgi:hypothetical protein
MSIENLVAQIDAEISRLQRAKSLLAASGASAAITTRRPGRPKKSAAVAAVPEPKAKKAKRKLTPEGRARIAEAVKRRWAAQKANKK